MGVHIYKVGFDLLILPDYLLFSPDLLKIRHENEIILSQRGGGGGGGGGGSSEPLEPPLHPPLRFSKRHFWDTI